MRFAGEYGSRSLLGPAGAAPGSATRKGNSKGRHEALQSLTARLRARATSSPSPATARTRSDTGTRDEQGFLKPKINVLDPVD